MGARGAAYNTGTGPIGLFTRFAVSLSPAVVLQYLLPKRALTVFAGWCAGSKATWWTRRVIPWFIRRY
ncbi:MAG: hypothetical protein K0M73_14335, partial [Hydrogenophaga sp.]|nr:hypothetical protein [Hydrogenophaga sp.]